MRVAQSCNPDSTKHLVGQEFVLEGLAEGGKSSAKAGCIGVCEWKSGWEGAPGIKYRIKLIEIIKCGG